MRSIRWISSASIFVLAVGMLSGCPNPGGLPEGSTAPPLAVSEWVKGGPFTLGDGEHIFVVEFWASWCPFCEMVIPRLTKLQADFADKDVVVLAVTNESAEDVNAYLAEQGSRLEYTVALDDDNQSFEAYEVARIPHAYVIDKAGTIIWGGHPGALGMRNAVRSLASE